MVSYIIISEREDCSKNFMRDVHKNVYIKWKGAKLTIKKKGSRKILEQSGTSFKDSKSNYCNYTRYFG
ncbi:hypothetical protein BOVMAS02_13410 [Streptococcus uberis]